MKFTVAQETRIGQRSNNEDRLGFSYLGEDILMMVVADGMGGHADGQVAAQYAVQVLIEAFTRYAKPRIPDPFLFFHTYIQYAHEMIVKHVETYQMSDAPRTTVVACLVQDNIAYWAHAGDSRLYLLRDRQIFYQTRDHSVVRQLLDNGSISSAQVSSHPDRNKVYNCLGGKIAPNIEFSRKTPLNAGDIIVLCSDGFWPHLSDPQFVRLLYDNDLNEILPRLTDEAVRRNGRGSDNTSVVAARWTEDYTEFVTGTMGESVVSQHSAYVSQAALQQRRVLSDQEIDLAIQDIRKAIKKDPGQ